MIKAALGVALIVLQASDWMTYTSAEPHFQLKYSPALRVHTLTISDYEKVFDFDSNGSRPLTLRVVDLSKYLPKTNTTNLQQYLQTFKAFAGYKEAQIAGKLVYEYVLCGRAACSQQVVFIHDNWMYDFSVDVAGTRADSVSFEKIPTDIQTIINSIEFPR